MTERKIEAIDLPWDFSSPVPDGDAVLDLSGSEVVPEPETEFDRRYAAFLAQSAGEKPADLSGGDDEETFYQQFREQSGMDAFAGRAGGDETREAADMSGSAGGDRTPGGTTGGFFGVEDLMRIAAEDGADMSEPGGEPGDDALPREVREAEELNDALRRQAQAEHFGPDEADGTGDEEMWAEYRKAVGEDR